MELIHDQVSNTPSAAVLRNFCDIFVLEKFWNIRKIIFHDGVFAPICIALNSSIRIQLENNL